MPQQLPISLLTICQKKRPYHLKTSKNKKQKSPTRGKDISAINSIIDTLVDPSGLKKFLKTKISSLQDPLKKSYAGETHKTKASNLLSWQQVDSVFLFNLDTSLFFCIFYPYYYHVLMMMDQRFSSLQALDTYPHNEAPLFIANAPYNLAHLSQPSPQCQKWAWNFN